MHSVTDYGAIGDGMTDDTIAVQQAYDAAATEGGFLFFPAGRYRCNLSMHSRSVDIRGEGRIASKLNAADPAKDILNAVFREGSWRIVTIADLELSNNPEGDPAGIGLGCGTDAYVTDDEFTGRINVERVSFVHLDRCIYRRQGQIGLWLTNCNFDRANYHTFTKAQDATSGRALMHGGCLFAKHCHFAGAMLASMYVNSPVVGTGQWSVEDCIFEQNAGFVLFVDGFADKEQLPSFNIVRCWNEANASAPNVTIEGQAFLPTYAWLRGCERAVFEDVPVSKIVLRENSNLILSRCDIGSLGAVDRDSTSSITIEDAYVYQGEVKEICRSFQIAGKLPPSAGGGAWWPRPSLTATTRAYGSNTLLKNDASSLIQFSGTFNRMTVSGSGASSSPTDNVQELTINAGETLLPVAQASLLSSTWCVAKYIYRLKSGQPITMQFTGNSGDTASATLDSSSWRTLVSIFQAGLGGDNSFYHFGPVFGSTTIELGGYSLTQFANRNDALVYGNDDTLAM